MPKKETIKHNWDFMLGEISERTKLTQKTLEQHVKDNKEVLPIITKNTTNINWLRWGVRGLYGSGLISMVVWLVVKYIKQ